MRPGCRRSLRRWQAVAVSVLLGLAMAVLAPIMRNAWAQGTAVAVGSGVVTTIGSWLLIQLGFERLHRKIEDRELALRKQAERQEFNARLNRALERSRTESDVLKTAMRAVGTIESAGARPSGAATLPVEALIADSSRAHLRRQASTGGDNPANRLPEEALSCQVRSPWDCPAMATSQSQHFADSGLLDTCPFLRDRAEATGIALTATCLPMASRGQAVGVLHAVRKADQPIPDAVHDYLRTIAERTGVTMGATRAFHRSQLQASTDPLTGLLNRRSFEERAANLFTGASRFALILADLDNFKTLNDVYGHSTGDRALRRFSQVLRSTTRPEDAVARIGGEEFVILIPQVGALEAAALAERLRAELLDQHTGAEPAFTVSLGVAEGTEIDDLDTVMAAADRALFAAKAGGRDQVVIASAETAVPHFRAQDIIPSLPVDSEVSRPV